MTDLMRFWMVNTATPYTPPTVRGSFTVTAGADIQLLGVKPAGTAASSSINVGTLTANTDVLLNRFVSAGAVAAGTLSGTAAWMIGCKENNAAANAFLHYYMYVTSGNTDTPRGVLMSDLISATEAGTTAVGVTEGSQTLSPVSVQIGDRIVFEVGYRASADATTRNATINYGNTGTTDLTLAATTVTTTPGWIDFSGTGGLFNTSFNGLNDNFANLSKWTASAGVSAVSNRARINCTSTNANMYTPVAWGFSGATVAFRVPTVPVAGGGSTVNFSSYLSPGPTITAANVLEINYSPNTGNLKFFATLGGVDAGTVTITYDPVAHLWWRYRYASGTVYMETSPDNSTWTVQRSLAPTQWMQYSTLIMYVEAVRASGTNDYAEIDNLNLASGHTIAVVQAQEIDTAQSLARSKTKALGTPNEVDTAQVLARTKNRSVTAANEVDAAQPVARTKTKALAAANEIDTPQLLTRVKTKSLTAASSLSTAQSLGATKTRLVGNAGEVDAAQALARAKTKAASAAGGIDTAQSLGAVKTRSVGVAGETDAPQLLVGTKTKAVGPAGEVDSPQLLAASKIRALTNASELSTAQPVTPSKNLAVVAAGEVDGAQTVMSNHPTGVGPAVEADAAQGLGRQKIRTVGPAGETDACSTLGRIKNKSTTPAGETDSTVPVGSTEIRAIGSVGEADAAQPVSRRKTKSVGVATELAEAQAVTVGNNPLFLPAGSTGQSQTLGRIKVLALGAAQSQVVAQRILTVYTIAVGPASSSSLASVIRPGRGRSVGAAQELDRAGAVTAVKLPKDVTIRLVDTAVNRWSALPGVRRWPVEKGLDNWTVNGS